MASSLALTVVVAALALREAHALHAPPLAHPHALPHTRCILTHSPDAHRAQPRAARRAATTRIVGCAVNEDGAGPSVVGERDGDFVVPNEPMVLAPPLEQTASTPAGELAHEDTAALSGEGERGGDFIAPNEPMVLASPPEQEEEVTVPDEPMVLAPPPELVAVPDEPMVLAPQPEQAATTAAAELTQTSGTSSYAEEWLDAAASETASVGEGIARGELVVRVPQIASEAELKELLNAGIAACDAERERTGRTPWNGRNRFSVSDPAAFSLDVVLLCEDILLRVMDRVDEQMPSVYHTLFRPSADWASQQPLTAQGQPRTVPPPLHLEDSCPTLRELYMAGELEWSEGEPAINVYTGNGHFGPHKDHMGLTVLIPLTCPTNDFAGGGTGFWSQQAGGGGSGDLGDENKSMARPEGPPTAVLAPSLGTALVFGGSVTHAAMPIESGLRSVMVASFSTRTPDSPSDRVHGLQCAPSSSSLRESAF